MPTPSTAFVVILGISTVFIGLIGLIILCKILGAVCSLSKEKTVENTQVSAIPQPTASTDTHIENRQEIIAAISAVLAEELGTEIEALRILSFKKI